MANEEIKLTLTSSDKGVQDELAKIEKALNDSGKAGAKAGDQAKKGADLAKGSFAALEKELRDNEKALKRMVIGSKEFTNQKRKVDALRRSYDQAGKSLGKHNRNASRLQSIGSAGVAKVGQMVAGMVTFQAAVTAIVAELEKGQQIKLRSAETERTLEQSLAAIGLNIGGDNIDTARNMIREAAPELGVSQEGLAAILGTAISAGADDLEEAMKVSAAALKITAGDAASANVLVGSALDVAAAGRSDNFEGAFGQISQVISQVRATNPAEFAANIGPALAAATAEGANVKGQTTEQVLELSAVVSQILKDQTGANTATAVRQFVTRMDAFAPELEATLKDGSEANLTKETIAKFRATDTFQGRVEMMRQNSNLAQQFLAQQKEGIGKVAIRQIVEGTKTARDLEAKAGGRITGIEEATADFQSLADNVAANTRILQAENKSKAALEKAQTQGPAAVRGQQIAIMERTLDNVDLPGLDAPLKQGMIADVQTGIMTPLEVLESLEAGEYSSGINSLFRNRMTDEDRKHVRDQIAIMKELLQATKEANQLRAQQAQKQGKQGAAVVKVQVENNVVRPVPTEAAP